MTIQEAVNLLLARCDELTRWVKLHGTRLDLLEKRLRGPMPADLKIEALERHARALTIRVEDLERQVRLQRRHNHG